MPTLNWIGKDAVINHHHDVPFKTLDKQYTFVNGETIIDNGRDGVHTVSTENKIIHGDNLEALKALLPEYEGKIKCIYIDPPYNTGNENWVYNDNVNSPRIRKWLGQVVGKEAEDLTRHDKWLCMMYPRLKLLHQLLSDDGAIFISIDDNEQANLKLICDEIFGSGNFVGMLPTIMNLKGNQDQYGFAGTHEYNIVYTKTQKGFKFGEFDVDESELEKWQEDNIGYFKKGATLKRTGEDAPREQRPWSYFPILVDNSTLVVSVISKDEYVKIYDDKTKKFDDEWISILESKYKSLGYSFLLPYNDNIKTSWRWSYKKVRDEKDEIIVIKGRSDFSLYKKQRPELDDLPSKKPKSIFYKAKYSSGNGTTSLLEILGEKKFSNPKPIDLISDFLQIATDKNSIILDSFAGSGTTAHAVLNLNKQDGGNRKFILVEMEDYAETITAERVRRVISGYGRDAVHTMNNGRDAARHVSTEGTGGAFTYYELGEPIMNGDYLNENQPIEKIREYIWYSETHTAYNGGDARPCVSTGNPYHLGNHNNAGYYFYYEKNKITTLDKAFLNTISEPADQYIIYADNCLLSDEFMRLNNIVFKKIPRDIRKF